MAFYIQSNVDGDYAKFFRRLSIEKYEINLWNDDNLKETARDTLTVWLCRFSGRFDKIHEFMSNATFDFFKKTSVKRTLQPIKKSMLSRYNHIFTMTIRLVTKFNLRQGSGEFNRSQPRKLLE